MKVSKITVISVALAVVALAIPFANANECCYAGKVTGGGIFNCACHEDKITFGFNVVRYPGEDTVKGELEYQDHTLGLNVHAHDIETLCVSTDGKSATFTGPCTINHESGFSFKAYVEDNGEPGCGSAGGTDVFELELFKGLVDSTDPWDYTGYHSYGTPIRGGNIQIHWSLPDTD